MKGNKKQKIMFFTGLLFVALILLATLTLIIALNNMQGQEKTIKTVELEAKQPQVEKPTKPSLERSEWTLEVLNGSGIAGAATKISRTLESLGYKVIKTGNAKDDTYTTIHVLIDKAMMDQAELLLADLKDTLPTATLSGELTDSTASARIIIGKE
ncbi:MAG: hypothetical protein A3D74_04255 [Candidatus Levybacteria bacterium RIFCSPHIGHO2_02_FULL_37_13]|nr:MAG: hypothetical protein A3D74_04255 [Candidatus Levybacteria bacterium RIFCSPHIGHO2_02_FULL_37_13]OGH39763.1 MAG: hypothetical protein A3B41_04230 [Candidatus Levybacteria bacterium RIFCSPLOWO2_01_FULL_37_26]